MKVLIFLFIFFICSRNVNAQTVIPQTTTAYDLSLKPLGLYRIIAPGDTLDLSTSTATKIHDTIRIIIHDTITIPCPAERFVIKLIMDSAKNYSIKYNRGANTKY